MAKTAANGCRRARPRKKPGRSAGGAGAGGASVEDESMVSSAAAIVRVILPESGAKGAVKAGQVIRHVQSEDDVPRGEGRASYSAMLQSKDDVRSWSRSDF